MAGTVDALERSAVLTLRRRPSLRMRLLRAVLRGSRMKRTLNNVAATEREREANRRRGPASPAAKLAMTHEFRPARHDGLEWVDIVPRDVRTDRTIVYLHGGGFINGPVAGHWDFMAALATENSARIIAPLYPLAPEGTAATVVPAMVALHLRLCEESADPPIWAGDSAGGGLALATAMRLRDEGAPLPGHLVLIAPWLDVALVHPRIKSILRRDRMAGLPGMRYAGTLWAGGLPTDSPLVSPVHGDLDGLPPMTVIVGTRDILLPDSRDLVVRAQAEGIDAVLVRGPGAVHSFPVAMSLPESAEARQVIAARLQSLGD